MVRSSGKNVKKRRGKSKIIITPLSKTVLQLTPRQVKYRKNRMSGMSIFAAAVGAGYTHNYARATATVRLDKLVKVSIIEELEMAGITNQAQARELARLAFKSTETEECEVYRHDEDGNIKVVKERTERPADGIRLKALEQAGKLKKQISAPFEKSIFGQEYTRLTIVVERDPEQKPEQSDERRENNINVETESRVALTD